MVPVLNPAAFPELNAPALVLIHTRYRKVHACPLCEAGLLPIWQLQPLNCQVW
jgi:hypothetical protein